MDTGGGAAAARRHRQARLLLELPRVHLPHRVRRAAPAGPRLRPRPRHHRRGAADRAPSTARACPSAGGQEPAHPGGVGSTTAPASPPTRRTTSRATCSTPSGSSPPSTGTSLDWDVARPAGGARSYPGRTSYDALNRPTSMTTPDGSVLDPVLQPGEPARPARRPARAAPTEATTFVAHLDYNARGQRTLIPTATAACREYAYDPLTFRLTTLTTLRGGQTTAGPALHLRPGRQPDAGPRPRPAADLLPQPGGRPVRLLHLRRALPADRGHRPRAPRPGRRRSTRHRSRRPRPTLPGWACRSPATAPRWPGTPSATSTTRSATCCGWRTAPPTTRTAAGPATTATDEPSLLEPGRHSNRLTGTGPAGTVDDTAALLL